ncbi:activating signal cointegrator 1 complex subunit [Orobanche hederae]
MFYPIGIEFFDTKSKRYVDFPITDILQMMGRSGWPQFDQHGKAIILVHEQKKSFYKKFLYEPFPVESSLREQLHDHINAEIVSKTICQKSDRCNTLSHLDIFNPEIDRLPDQIVKKLKVTGLFQFMKVDRSDTQIEETEIENMVEPTMLGSIASQYYLKYTTVSMFASNIKADTSLEVFLHVLSGASEYDELPVRHNEENHNAELSSKVHYMVDKNILDDLHVKANLLFQAHFSRVELPITDYVIDLKSVMDQSIRVIHSMIDLCANSGWLSSTITCMHLLQMVMQGLWDENKVVKSVSRVESTEVRLSD